MKSDEETGQTIISGMGELHLEILVDRMKREFKVEANVGKPQVAYRETLRKTVSRYDYTHKKQSGGSGQFAKIQISLEPLPTGSEQSYEFVNKITGVVFRRSTSHLLMMVARKLSLVDHLLAIH